MDDRIPAQVDKLAHELEEIRVRALTSIISKLDLAIIKEKDLINKSNIFVKLLDWFNFPVVPCKRDVLQLISRLVKERDGAFYLHIVDPGLEHLKKAVGNEFLAEIREISESIELSDDYLPIESPSIERKSHKAILSCEESLSTSENILSLSTSTSDRSKEWLYSEIYWPVPRLDESDSRVLATVGNLLSNKSEYTQAANFFSTVLLHDFPPQVFLQDTTILNALFALFEEGGNHQYVVPCFKEFTHSLFKQFKFYEDPASIEMVCHVSKDGDDTALCEWANPDAQDLSEHLGVGEYCALSLEKLSYVVPGALHLLRLCIRDPVCFWNSTSGIFIKTCLSNHMAALATKVKSSRINDQLTRLENNTWICHLLSFLIPVEASSSVVHHHLQTVLAEELYNPCLCLFYPRIHNEFKSYVSTFKYLEDNNFEEVNTLAESITAAGKFISDIEKLSIHEALSYFYTGLLSLDIHHEISIIKKFFKLITSSSRLLSSGEEELAEKNLLSLLSHMDLSIQEETYCELTEVLNEVLGPPAAINKSTMEYGRIQFIFSPTVLKEIVNFGLISSSSKVVINAEKILILIVKAKLLLTAEQWTLLLVSINVIMPLLQAFASDSTPLGRCILQILDPDVAADMSFHPLQVLSGNTRLLFSKNPVVFAESYARLIYLLGISPDSRFSMPDVPILPQTSTPISVFNEENIPRLIEVLKTADGKMLSSAIIQVSLISEQPSLHIPLLDSGALPLLLDLLNTSLENITEYTTEHYSSIVVVLKNLASHNIQLRNDFSTNYNLLSNVLKGLFLLPGERRWVTNTLQLLALMVYSEFLIFTDGILSLPIVLVDNLKFPFHIRAQTLSSLHTLASMKSILVGRRDICQYIGSIWCFTQAGTPENFVTNFNKLPCPPHPLELPPKKCFILVEYELERSLIDIKVASSHQAASNALECIQRFLKFTRWVDDKTWLEELPWEQSFKRYLLTVPASPADQILLIEILCVLEVLIGVLPHQVNWVSKFVRDPSTMLCTLLTQTTVEDCTSLKKELSLQLLVLVEKCLTQGDTRDWEPVAIILLQSLNHSHTQKFYSLAVVDRLLGCLVRLSRDISVPGSEGPLWKLLSAFHCPSKTSFMGLTITRRALFALNSILSASKDFKIPEEAVWISKLLSSRDAVIAAAALELSSHLSRTQSNLNRLLNYIPDIWDLAIRLLLDHRQSSLVREHAAYFCCNMINNSQNKVYVTSSIENKMFECFAVLFSNKNTQIKPEDIFTFHMNNSADTESSYYSGATTERLITHICCLTVSLMVKDPKKIVAAASSASFISSLARDINSWQCEKITTNETVNMFESILRVLVYARSDLTACSFVTDAVHTLLWLLLPSTYDEGVKKCGVMKESLRLLSVAARNKSELVISGEAVTSICKAITSQDSAMSSAAASAIPSIAAFLPQSACIELIQAIGCRDNMRPALASVVGNSHSATLVALEIGVLDDCICRLRSAQLSLALAPRNSKKALVILEELHTEFTVLTNLLAGCNRIKEEAAALGLADSIHKLWLWIVTDFALLSAALRALITFTASCPIAAGTLVLTSTLVGVGQRKSPTSSSLLHAVLTCLLKEIFSPGVKVLFLQLLMHTSQAPECRHVILKSNFLSEFIKVHDQKKTSCIDEMETYWLEFLCAFTSFTEGQSSIIKSDEVIEKLLDYLSGNRGEKHKSPALSIIRNLIFNPANRQKFILSEKVLDKVSDRLTELNLSDEEFQDVLLIAWSLSANSQRGKMSIRAAGVASRLESALLLQLRPPSIQKLVDTILPILYS